MSDIPEPVWPGSLKADYQTIFINQWSPYLGAVLLVLIMAVLMGSGLFWGVFGGIKLWGDYLNNAIGMGALLHIKPQLENVLMHRISLMNITLVMGSFSAALLSMQFHINRPPKLEYIWAMLGGTFMGIGSTFFVLCGLGNVAWLASGCSHRFKIIAMDHGKHQLGNECAASKTCSL
jgi:hypothetical protein